MSQNKTTTRSHDGHDSDDEDLTMVQRWKIQDDIENKVPPPPTNPNNANPQN